MKKGIILGNSEINGKPISLTDTGEFSVCVGKFLIGAHMGVTLSSSPFLHYEKQEQIPFDLLDGYKYGCNLRSRFESKDRKKFGKIVGDMIDALIGYGFDKKTGEVKLGSYMGPLLIPQSSKIPKSETSRKKIKRRIDLI